MSAIKREEIIGDCRLILGDCINIIPLLGKVNAVVSDPPYGMDYRSGHNSSRKGVGAKLARKDGNFSPIVGDRTPFDPSIILNIGAPSIIWGANHFCSSLPETGRWLVWNKLCGKTPLPSGSDIELAWCSQGGPDRIFDHLWRGIMRAGEENIVNNPKFHPNQKPIALMSWCLGFAAEGLVLDPFMGSGTTAVACSRVSRPFIGIEIDEGYFEIACERVRKAYDQPDMFVERPDPPKQEELI